MKNSSTKVIGALFAIVGIICMCFPIVSTLWIDIMVGAGLIVGAVFALVEVPAGEGFWDRLYYLCLALLYAAGGIFMFLNPIAGSAAMMVALGIIFLMEGILIFIYWGNITKSHKGLLLLNGIVTFILGLLILTNISQGLWFIGTLVGIDLIFTGITMLAAPTPSEMAKIEECPECEAARKSAQMPENSAIKPDEKK